MPLEKSQVKMNSNSKASHTYKDRFTANIIRCLPTSRCLRDNVLKLSFT